MFSIGQLSKATGVKVPTIRYYEEVGLLPQPGRNAGNQRRYGQDGMDALGFIKHARDLGFSLEDIKALMGLDGHLGDDCAEADRIARSQLANVRDRIRKLEQLATELERISHLCDGGNGGCCKVLTALGDHSQCAGEHG
ncbi:helix-turn-helix domain-containing protein [Leisingera caerulea]|uniref:Helix-turn-helix domain-containing protein n=1 Tax=Leisingera caerulea TaxID=506591 RepID=A0A9Q9M0Q7_LEICA|nr:helix-turn-helix domain-containing protein [Leisingera caerulea]UWQ49726.1 helix-turn-helix domain-containing protein [Leisingera caerulea]UWQ53857.1 helix-turn-helix domain-containing protein [Leisingera caerulea]UWQ58451.1 helix-turn-helix domain-containing protein [Leisingera caerulea]UWQ83503.1 helix-turn-helix domain-containing protein [Leisingera caerulea]